MNAPIPSSYITRKLERALKQISGNRTTDLSGYITRKLERALKHYH